MLSLRNKQIVLGMTGGIAAYKSAELCRVLVKAGAEVRVVMTRGAREFITPLTMQALSGQRVHTELLDEDAEAAMGHIELARWADLILIAPASANFIARLAHGEADDLLTTLCLASTAPMALAPAMNQAMWLNPQTQNNLEALKAKNLSVFGPAEGEQACGDIGPGRMLEAQTLAKLAAGLFETGSLAGRKVLITGGPTREAIDPVRYISNHSSGKMAYAIAEAASEAGAEVTLVSGPVTLPPPAHTELISVESAEEMLAACLQKTCDIFIGVAAVADYRVLQRAPEKIKKDRDEMQLTLVKNPDILATMAAAEPRPFCVGFAAETGDLEHQAKAKLQAKRLDLIFANDAVATFEQDEAEILALWAKGKRLFPRARKGTLARDMIRLIAGLFTA